MRTSIKDIYRHKDFWLGAQTIILLFTLFAAIWIGGTQNSINQKLFDLNSFPSIYVSYYENTVQITNLGKIDIVLYRVEIDKYQEDLSLVIQAGTTLAANVHAENGRFQRSMELAIQESVSFQGNGIFPFKFYFKTVNGENFNAEGDFLVYVLESGLEIRPRLTNLKKID